VFALSLVLVLYKTIGIMETLVKSRTLSGPLTLFDGSFIIEFLEPHASLDSS